MPEFVLKDYLCLQIDGKPIGAVRPKLLALSQLDRTTETSPLLLVGGRPGLFLWLSVDAGLSWKTFNLARIHNELEPDPWLKFCPGTVEATPSNSSQYL